MSIKFAVVREDPSIELAVARRFHSQRALLVASGGCTAFAMAAALPAVDVSLYDFNPDQLQLVRDRAAAISRGDTAALNVGDASPEGLSQCGEFESLFRLLRAAMLELVAAEPEVEAWFNAGPAPDARAIAESWIQHRFWPSLFHIAFNDAFLVAMFGPDAVQHAPPGSYPGYFQAVFERGLRRPDGPANPFLQHVFLGRYLERDAPPFLSQPAAARDFAAHLGGLPDVPGLERYDLVHVSNIFDWSADGQVAEWCDTLKRLRPGAVVVVRQLNNERDLRRFLSPAFRFEDALGRRLQEADRSLFYNRVEIAVRVSA